MIVGASMIVNVCGIDMHNVMADLLAAFPLVQPTNMVVICW